MTKKTPQKIPEKSVNDKAEPELQKKNSYKEKKQEKRTDFEKEQDKDSTNKIKKSFKSPLTKTSN